MNERAVKMGESAQWGIAPDTADVHPMTVVDPTAILGERVKIWQFATLCEGVEIGDDVVIGSSVWIGRHTFIGDGTRIQDKVHISPRMHIGRKVFIGPCVTFTDDKRPVVGNTNYKAEPAFVCDGASIGAGAVILPGVTIGANSLIGAGSVVTRDVPEGATVYGNPAKAREGRTPTPPVEYLDLSALR